MSPRPPSFCPTPQTEQPGTETRKRNRASHIFYTLLACIRFYGETHTLRRLSRDRWRCSWLSRLLVPRPRAEGKVWRAAGTQHNSLRLPPSRRNARQARPRVRWRLQYVLALIPSCPGGVRVCECVLVSAFSARRTTPLFAQRERGRDVWRKERCERENQMVVDLAPQMFCGLRGSPGAPHFFASTRTVVCAAYTHSARTWATPPAVGRECSSPRRFHGQAAGRREHSFLCPRGWKVESGGTVVGCGRRARDC